MILDDVEIVTKDTVGGFNLLVYGPSGVGKTVFAASAQDVPAMRDVLFLDIEGGMRSVVDRADIARKKITDPDQLEKVYDVVSTGKAGDYNTIVIDSITELQNLDMNKRAQRKGGKKTLEMWGESTTYLGNLFRAFKDLETVNVILTALPKSRFDDETSKLVEVGPDLTPKLSNSVMGMQDAVWYLYTREVKDVGNVRSLLTQPKGAYRAKTRGVQFAAALGDRVDNPTMAAIYEVFANDTMGVAA